MIRRVIGLLTILVATTPLLADGPKTPKAKKQSGDLTTGKLDTKDWLKFPTTPLEAGEIDRVIGAALQKANLKPAPLTTDEQFIRRLTLDMTGKLPSPKAIQDFAQDAHTEKRARLIDQLLDSDDFAKHWALYFKDVIVSKSTNQFANLSVRGFEKWLIEQFKANKSWATTTKALLSGSGQLRYDAPDKNSEIFFLASRMGADAQTELAAETSRIFLGIQIQCAQCHDHPSDVWKRQNFHEFAAYFARVRTRLIREEMKFVGTELVSLPFGEHKMPNTDDPKKGATVRPRFLDGTAPVGFNLNDQKRREALAEAIVSRNNPWFAAAFVNRIWGELMGQSFYTPVDDLGPQKDAVMPEALGRFAAAFRGDDYNVKNLFRSILNSETYQRQTRAGESGEPHLLFAAHSPTRMSANSLWQSLVGVLGEMGGPGQFGGKGAMMGKGPFGGAFGLEGLFKREFAFDPSTKPDEVEGSVSQALLLMNNPQIHNKIRATGNNMLKRVLDAYSDDGEAIRAVYLRTLARRPTGREMARCREHIHHAGSRAEAFEDLLWALINSTEFQTKR